MAAQDAPKRSRRRLLGVVTGVAAVGMLGTLIDVMPARANDLGSFGLGSAGSGLVDERTHLLSMQVPLGDVSGSGVSATALGLVYAQGSKGSPGLAAGWSFGLSEVRDGELSLGDGRSYAIDPSRTSGMKDYKLEDARFEEFASARPAGSADCPATRDCRYSFVKFDGERIVFDTDGLMAAKQDRFGNTALFEYDADRYLTAVIGGDENARGKITLGYSSNGVKVSFPKRVDGVVPVAKVTVRGERVTQIEDPVQRKTSITWDTYYGQVLPKQWVNESGALTEIEYRKSDPGIVAVAEVRVLEADTRKPLQPATTFSLNPGENEDDHNWTGYPKYHTTKPAQGKGTSDALVASDDRTYTYKTSVSQGGVTTIRTFNNQHVKVSEETRASMNGSDIALTRITYRYPGMDAKGNAPKWESAPPMYQAATKVTTQVIDPTNDSRVQESTIEVERDSLGRTLRQRAANIETVTTYDTGQTEALDAGVSRGYGLPTGMVQTVVDGKDSGHFQKESIQLADDRKSAALSTIVATDPTTGEPTEVRSTRTNLTGAGIIDEEVVTTIGGGSSQESTSAVRYELDGAVRVVTTTDTNGISTVAKLDAVSGLLLEQTDAAGQTVTRTYDEAGRVTSIRDAHGTSMSIGYEHAGIDNSGVNRVTTTRDADGYAVREVSDTAGRIIRAEDNQKSGKVGTAWRVLKRNVYDDSGRLSEAVDAAGRTSTYRFDSLDRPTEVIGSDGSRATTEYDEIAGTTITKTYPSGAKKPRTTTTQTVNRLGQATSDKVEYGDGTAGNLTTYTYRGFGAVESVSDERSGSTVHSRYDAAGNLIENSILGGEGKADALASYARDALGNMTGKTLAMSGQEDVASHAYGFDASGRPLSETTGDGESTIVGYDEAGRVITTTYPDGRIMHSGYNATTGTIERTWWTAPGSDAPEKEVRFGSDPVTGQVAEIWYADDKRGTLLRYSYQPDGALKAVGYPDGSTLTFHYDDLGVLTALTDPVGTKTEYGYDERGTLASVTNGTARLKYLYNKAGDRIGTERFDVKSGKKVGSTSYTANDAGQLLEQKNDGAHGELILKETHSYGRTGLLESTVTERGDQLLDGGVTAFGDADPLAGATSYTSRHTYDGNDRLTGTVIRSGTSASGTVLSETAYEISASGDVTKATVTTPGGSTTTEFGHDVAGRQVSVTVDGETVQQEFDANGNLVVDAAGTRNEFAIDGTLAKVTTADGAVTAYTWRPDGTRHTRTDPDGAALTTFTLPGATAQVVAETRTENGASTTYSALSGFEREGTMAGGDIAWLGHGRRGDVTYTQDGAGMVLTRTHFSDYGIPTTAGEQNGHQPFGYTGAYTDRQDGGTGLVWLAARHYNPSTSHFISEDSFQLLNRYTYADGAPTNFTDPTGHAPKWASTDNLIALTLAIGGGIFGVMTGGVGWVITGVAIATTLADVVMILDKAEVFMGEQQISNDGHKIAGYVLMAVGAADLLAGVGAFLSRMTKHSSITAGMRGAWSEAESVVASGSSGAAGSGSKAARAVVRDADLDIYEMGARGATAWTVPDNRIPKAQFAGLKSIQDFGIENMYGGMKTASGSKTVAREKQFASYADTGFRDLMTNPPKQPKANLQRAAQSNAPSTMDAHPGSVGTPGAKREAQWTAPRGNREATWGSWDPSGTDRVVDVFFYQAVQRQVSHSGMNSVPTWLARNMTAKHEVSYALKHGFVDIFQGVGGGTMHADSYNRAVENLMRHIKSIG